MKIVKNRILDNEGRTLVLRGVNLGGSSKIPFGPPGWGMRPESLLDRENASFAGRPFPEEEAESHFERLSRGGMTFLRLIITWEALEHAGPGLYDEAFLAYARKMLLAAERHGISVFIDPHQDAWSRWTGGDGAPAWTMEKIGFDLGKLDETGAALTRPRYAEFHQSRKYPQGEPYPRMVWPGNYNRYAAATMFTLFFGGKTYAPDLTVDGENVQDWLQNKYIAAFRHCYRRLKNCGAIAGWGVMNEPHNGFIGCRDIAECENTVLPVGPRPSPWDSMQAASGYPVAVPVYSALSLGKRSGKKMIFNPKAESIFKDGFCCPWKQAGVWADEGSAPGGGRPRIKRQDHFALFEGRQAHFLDDFHKPFNYRYMETMKTADEKTFFFIEGIPPSMSAAEQPAWDREDNLNLVNAFHWYDGFSLFTKSFRPWFTITPDTQKIVLGRKNVQAYYDQCLEKALSWCRDRMGNIPSLLGEFGLAFDINSRRAFSTGDYSLHEEALSMYYDAVDKNLLHSTIWNYTADNTTKEGDGWNEEDLSIFSEGKERAAGGWKRPYPMATAGELLAFSWNRKEGTFRCRFRADASIAAPSIIYLPAERFTAQAKIASPLRFEYKPEEQKLFIYNDGFSGEAEIAVS